MIMAKQYEHAPTCEDIQKDLLPFIKKHKPKNILTDNNPFKKDRGQMAKTKRRKTTLHAHPYYPQDKGKIERAIQKRNPRIHKPHQKIPPLAKQPPQQIQKPVQPPKNTPRHKNHTLHTIHHQTPRQLKKNNLSFSQKPPLLTLSHLSKNHQNKTITHQITNTISVKIKNHQNKPITHIHPKPITHQTPKLPQNPTIPTPKKRTVALSTLLNTW